MAEGKICVCPQCGKKFKLKPEFDAASFACSGCGATVWVEGKPKVAAPGGRRRSASGGRSRGGSAGRKSRGRAAAAAPAAGRGRRGRGRAEEPADEGEERGRGRYQRKQDNTLNIVFAVIGLVLIVAIPVILFTMSGKDEQPAGPGTGTEARGATGTEPGSGMGPGPAAGTDAGTAPGPAAGTTSPGPEAPEGTPPEQPAGDEGGDTTTPPPADDEPEVTRRLGGSGSSSSSGGIRKSRYDPEPDLGHLESTPPDLRAKIDSAIDLVFDPFAGIDGQRAKQELIAIGKPAFVPLLARMAKVRDQLPAEADPSNIEVNNLGASLKLADEALREMDGYLTANSKDVIRPGHTRKYVAYILRLHYKRWLTTLKDMAEMPGPFDPSQEYEKETERYEGD